MNMMFSCLFGVGYVVVRYRKSGFLRRLSATPVTAFEFGAAQVLSRLLLTISVTALIYGALALFVPFRNEGSVLLLLLIAIVGALSMIAFGFMMAARFASEELANGAINLASWPMMLLSGVWFSLEGAPAWLQQAAKVLPLTQMLDAARAVMLDGAGLADSAAGAGLARGDDCCCSSGSRPQDSAGGPTEALSRRRPTPGSVADFATPRPRHRTEHLNKSELLKELRIDRDAPENGSSFRLGLWIAIGGAVLLAIAAALWYFNRDNAIEVTVEAARAMPATSAGASVLDATGYVTARRQATVSAKITGKVREVRIEEGQRVEAGEILATLDDSEARVEVELRRAQVASARAQLVEAEASSANAGA